MSGGTAPGPPESLRPTRRLRGQTWISIVVVLLASIGSFELGWYLGMPTAAPPVTPPSGIPSPPVSYVMVSQGNLSLHVPLMTAYTPDNASFPGVTALTRMRFVSAATNTSVAFDWAVVTGPSLPVRFMWRDAAIHGINESLGRFVVTPNTCSNCGSASTGWDLNESNWSVAMVVDIGLSYTVLTAAVLGSPSTSSWLQVNYSLSSVQPLGLRLPSPYAGSVYNVTLPQASDLAPVGGAFPMTLPPFTSRTFDVSEVLPPSAVYRNPLPAVPFDAGRFGVIHARPVSAFSWVEPNEYRIRVDRFGEAPVTVQMYVDMRFGSLYAVFLA